MSANSYKRSYFQRRKNVSLNSAKITIEKLANFVRLSSVVDFGCGTGTWLAACQNAGATKILGFDHYAKESELLIQRKYFHRKSVADEIDLEEKYDLAISLEAAEHVEQIYADTIIKNLTNASDVILFRQQFLVKVEQIMSTSNPLNTGLRNSLFMALLNLMSLDP